MKYFVIIFTLFFSLFFLSSNNDAYGLSCEQPDMKRHFAESDVVFSGKAISQEYFPSEYGFANGRNDTKTQFQVIESFKGDNKKIMNVTSSEWFWGYDFNKGLEYVVFAYYDDNNDLRHQTCTSTSLLKDADIVKIRQASSFAESFSITEKQVRYNIPYKITNGIIDDVTLSCDDGSLLLQVTAQDESDVTLILDLPRNILDPKINGRDDRFIVLGDGQEIDYEEMPYTKHRKLSMSFSSDTNEIEIIHSFIPELKPKMCEVVHDPPYSYMLPPLIQFNSEIPFNEIQCKQNLVLIQKYDGSPACVTESTKLKLVERGWTNMTPIEPDLGKIGTYELQHEGKTFDIKYHIKGGSDIKEIISDDDSNAINIILERDYDGALEITLPRELIDAKISKDVDDLFFVLIDEEEVPYTETTTDATRTLTIQFEKDSKVIEILGAMPL